MVIIIKYTFWSLAVTAMSLSVAFSSEFLKTPATVLGDNYGFIEGPVWVADKQLWLFSDIPMNKIYSLDRNGNISIWMDNSGFANGLAVDENNNIWIAHHCRKISKTTPDGVNTIIATKFEGKKLNSPNDIVIKNDGTAWFTDPNYGIAMAGFGCEVAEDEQPVRGIYQIKDGDLSLKTGVFQLPNGLAFSNDEKYLYVSEAAEGTVYRFDVVGDNLTNKIAWAKIDSGQPPHPQFGYTADGLKVDKNGNVYVAGAFEGFAIFSPEGKQLELFKPDAGASESPFAGFVSNIAIGGVNGNQLLVTVNNQLLMYELK